MKAKWCQSCEQLIDAAYRRCPNCSSLLVVDVETYIKRLLKTIKIKKRRKRKTKKQEQRYEEPDDGHMSLGEEQAMRNFGIKV